MGVLLGHAREAAAREAAKRSCYKRVSASGWCIARQHGPRGVQLRAVGEVRRTPTLVTVTVAVMMSSGWQTVVGLTSACSCMICATPQQWSHRS
jgi:hypothetical protein